MRGLQLWRASLDQPADEVARLFDLLAPVERSRAGMFHHERDRRRFVVVRGILRTLLGECTSTPPDRVVLGVLPGGKPVLAAGAYPHCIHFNLSHCGDVALFAFADREVGIDVERLAPSDDMARVATHFFSSTETVRFNQLSGIEQTRFFFRTWVRKEAYLKATGDGFAIEPALLTVASSTTGGVSLQNADGTQITDGRYVVHDVDDVDEHVAAVAITAAYGSEADLPVSRPVVLEEFSPHVFAGIQT